MTLREKFKSGLVIPAHPLALNSARKLDERRQRALTRYYRAAGAGGVAVGVHTTQFAIRKVGLLQPVLELAAEEVRGSEMVKIAGVCRPCRRRGCGSRTSPLAGLRCCAAQHGWTAISHSGRTAGSRQNHRFHSAHRRLLSAAARRRPDFSLSLLAQVRRD